jgi:hypothetical protein
MENSTLFNSRSSQASDLIFFSWNKTCWPHRSELSDPSTKVCSPEGSFRPEAHSRHWREEREGKDVTLT